MGSCEPQWTYASIIGPHGRAVLLKNDYMDSEYMDKLKVWMIPQECLDLSTPLGQGQFGKVFSGHLKMKSGMQKKVAVKTIKGEERHLKRSRQRNGS